MFGRDQALSQQSIEFLQTKISQLQQAYDEKSQVFEGRLEAAKRELQEDAGQ